MTAASTHHGGTGRRARRLARCGLGAAMLLLQACASPGTPREPNATDATRTLRTTYDYIFENYYVEPSRKAIGMAGIRNLKTLEPGLEVTEADGRAKLLLDGARIHEFRIPARGAADTWAGHSRESIQALMSASPRVAELTWIETVDAVLHGAARGLDEHAVYLSRSEMVAIGLETVGGTGSVGIRLREQEEATVIAQVRRGSTAAAAGLLPGDRIERVNGQVVSQFTKIEQAMLFVGSTNSETSVTVNRGGATADIVVPLEDIDDNAPVVERHGELLYLQLTGLAKDTADKVKDLLEEEKARPQAERPKGLVLDLRGAIAPNPFAAAFFMDLFFEIGSGNYYSIRAQSAYKSHRFQPRSENVDPEIPIAVLVNGGTESTAEAMAAAIADLGRGIVVGSATGGLGRIYAGPVLMNGGIFILTQSLLHAASGYGIERRGILPMVCTSGLTASEPLLARLSRGEGVIDYAARNRAIGEFPRSAIEEQRARCPAKAAQDNLDLEIAEAILRDPALYRHLLSEDQLIKAAAKATRG